jgi:pilus assembly protein Flp/PilA
MSAFGHLQQFGDPIGSAFPPTADIVDLGCMSPSCCKTTSRWSEVSDSTFHDAKSPSVEIDLMRCNIAKPRGGSAKTGGLHHVPPGMMDSAASWLQPKGDVNHFKLSSPFGPTPNGRYMSSFLKDEGGATHIEYALLVALIGIACVVALDAVGGSLQSLFGSISDALPSAPTGGRAPPANSPNGG